MKKFFLILLLIPISYGLYAQKRIKDDENHTDVSYVGKKLPNFSVVEWISDKPDCKGKYRLIDFWGIFSYPVSSITVPHLNKLSRKFKDVVFIGFALDKAFYVKQVEDPIIKYYSATVVWKEIMSEVFKFEGLPVTLLVNPQGKVIWQGFVLKIKPSSSDIKDRFFLTESKLREMINKDKKENI